MERFFNYIEQFDPDFKNRIEGVTEEDIQKHERLVEFALPEEYKEFLRRFGRKPDLIKTFFINSDVDLLELTRWYLGIKDGSMRAPKNALVISVGQGFFESQIVMKLDTDARELDIYDEDLFEGRLAHSLEAFLCSMVYRKYRLGKKEFIEYLNAESQKNNTKIAKEIDFLLLENRFEKLWFSSDLYSTFYEKDDLIIFVTSTLNDVCALTFGAMTENEIEKIKQLLSEFNLIDRYYSED